MGSPTKRIIVNTTAQYAKAVVNMGITLYTTRLVLDVLSISDYGIFSVIGGVVSLLGFVTNALVITTQRYISYHSHDDGQEETRRYFASSLLLHLIVGLVLLAALLALKPLVVNDFLNIDPSRIPTAGKVYVVTAMVLFITLITAPYKALFIAHENIVFVSVVEVADCLLKLVMVLWLTTLSVDKLLAYSLLLAFMHFCTLLAYMFVSLMKYDESCVMVKLADVKRQHLLQLTGFAGWSTYGMGAVTLRVQGYAFILNRMFGTVINAAYGVALQVFGAIAFISSSIMNAMNPQIMAAEGLGDRKRMLHLSMQESKFTSTILMVVLLPILVEMPNILGFWLKEVPPHTTMFCRYVLTAFLADQTTYGLNTANQALGNIRNYTLLMYTPKLLTLPLAWMFLRVGWGVESIMILYLGVEIAVALARIPFTCFSAGLSARQYVRQVIGPLTPLCLLVLCCCWAFSAVVQMPLRFFCTFAVGVMVGLPSAWFLVLGNDERRYILSVFHHKTGIRHE